METPKPSLYSSSSSSSDKQSPTLLLGLHKRLHVGVLPQRFGDLWDGGRERLARQPTVTVQPLQQALRAGDGSLGDSEIALREDALQTLRLREERFVCASLEGELEQFNRSVLKEKN